MHKNTSTSLVGEMQIKTTDTTLYLLEWLIPKRQKIINVGEGVEKREPLYTVGAATMKSSMESLQKIKNNTTIGQSFSACVYLSKECNTNSKRHMHLCVL